MYSHTFPASFEKHILADRIVVYLIHDRAVVHRESEDKVDKSERTERRWAFISGSLCRRGRLLCLPVPVRAGRVVPKVLEPASADSDADYNDHHGSLPYKPSYTPHVTTLHTSLLESLSPCIVAPACPTGGECRCSVARPQSTR